MTTSFISLAFLPDPLQRMQAAESRDDAIGTGGGENSRSAWLREMEREQMQGWLDNPVTAQTGQNRPVLHTPDVDAIAKHLDLGRLQQADVSLRPEQATFQNRLPEALNSYYSNSPGAVKVGIDVSPVPEDEKPVVAQRLIALAEQRLMRSRPRMDQRDHAEIERLTDDSIDQERLSDAAAVPQDAEAASVPRVSVQWFGNDIKIWIGIGKKDGLSSKDFEHLLRESKSLLAAEGCQLLAMTCNGELIYNNSTNQES